MLTDNNRHQYPCPNCKSNERSLQLYLAPALGMSAIHCRHCDFDYCIRGNKTDLFQQFNSQHANHLKKKES